MALNINEKAALVKEYCKHKFTIVESSKPGRKRIKQSFRQQGFSDLAQFETYKEAWEKLELSTTHFLVFSIDSQDGLDFLRDLIDSTRFKRTPLMIFTKKINEHPKIFGNADIKAVWGEAPMTMLQLENAYLKVFQGGVVEPNQIINESESISHFTKALIEINEENYEEAKELLRQSLKENPDFFEAYIKMAEMLIALGDYKTAKRVIVKAASLRPEDSNCMLLEAKLAMETESKEDAVKVCDEKVSKRPRDMMFITEIGNAALSKGWTDIAIRYFQMAKNVDPNVIHIYNQLGIAYSRSNDYDGALAMYDLALEIDQEDAGIHFNKGMMYLRKRNEGDAMISFKKAVAADPKMVEAHDFIKKLEEKSLAAG